jgi:hypothetical protein
LGKLEIAFAVIPVVAAAAVGGLLFMAYPDAFSGYGGPSGETSTASTSQYATNPTQAPSAAGTNNTTSSGTSSNSTAQSTGTSAQSGSGY